MTAMAIGERKAGSAPRPIAIGSMPAPIAIVVITIGRLRLWQASTSASGDALLAWLSRHLTRQTPIPQED